MFSPVWCYRYSFFIILCDYWKTLFFIYFFLGFKFFDRLVVAFLETSVLEEFGVLYGAFRQYQYDAKTKVPKKLFLFLFICYLIKQEPQRLCEIACSDLYRESWNELWPYCQPGRLKTASDNSSRLYSSILDCELNPRPNTELFLVCIFLYSDWIQENTDQKYLRIWTLFTQCFAMIYENKPAWSSFFFHFCVYCLI